MIVQWTILMEALTQTFTAFFVSFNANFTAYEQFKMQMMVLSGNCQKIEENRISTSQSLRLRFRQIACLVQLLKIIKNKTTLY